MILDRYVFRLWLAPFAAGLILATGVLLFGRALKLLALMTDSGAPWLLMGELMLFVLPYFLLLTIPIAFFL
ncbi:MAG: LptF/LptG family permease, partial [Mariprofundaceae bacterium]|nr:LptF/LptG family permease [Mariprofundaceae bacterium]